ncbi:SGNH/GDSL hydrolase family protein [Desulfotomaculum nigrificans]|uniref:SGNH/GDSL hydrolase family protein n=1 Tax=Desulfotomaculum nigrificans TaxID=1565 RepID=UPI0001FAE4FC|nr:SGNH/GDSL hydrolase family protein [Desulfotomaculum nigrificans]
MISVRQADLSVIKQQKDAGGMIRAHEAGTGPSYYSRVRAAVGEALRSAESRGLKSLLLPVVDSKRQDINPDMLAKIMVSEVRRHLTVSSGLTEVNFLLEDAAEVQAFANIINRTKIVCLGDSITYGYPDGPQFSWVAVLTKATGREFINRGVNGETTGQMLDRFAQDVLPEQPAYLILLGGANDGWQGVPLDEVQSNITQITEQALANGICPLLGLPTPLSIDQLLVHFAGTRQEAIAYEHRLNDIRSWVSQFAAQRGLLTLDFYTPLLSTDHMVGDANLLLDGGHPTHLGYRLLGEALVKQLTGKLHWSGY